MSKIVTLTAGAVGFLLGSRAGRQPYDRFTEQAQRLAQDPRVRSRVDQGKGVVQDKAGQAARSVRGTVGGQRSSDRSPQDDSPSTPPLAGPQGPLP